MQRNSHLWAFFFLICLSTLASAQTQTFTFEPADGSRTYMDRGGVWNGTSEVTTTTGDTFKQVIDNPLGSGKSLFELFARLRFESNANFQYVANSITVALSGVGCGVAPTVSATQTSKNVDVTFTPAGYDLPEDCEMTLTYGVNAPATIAAGSYVMRSFLNYANADAGGLANSSFASRSITVNSGSSILTIAPTVQTVPIDGEAVFDVQVCNSGFGGLFEVAINESLINPNAANSLQVTTMTQTSPVAPIASGVVPLKTIPYLAAGQCYNEDTRATVTACTEINNQASTNDRNAETAGVFDSNVKLDFQTPLADFVLPVINVPASGATSITIPIDNTSPTSIQNLVVDFPSNFNDVVISNVGADWIWNAGTKKFTYTGGTPAGTLPTAASVDLTFSMERAPSCSPKTPGRSGFYVLTTSYKDGCGNDYVVPSKVQSFSIADATTALNFAKNPQTTLLPVKLPGESGSFALTVTPADTSLLDSSVVITDVLPAGLENYVVGVAPAGVYTCSGTCSSGDTLTWTIPEADVVAAGGPLTLNIDYDVENLAAECTAKTITNTAQANFTELGACAQTQNSSSGITLDKDYGAITTGLDIDNAPVSGSSYETGISDNDGDDDNIRDINLGEGEFINWRSDFESNDPAIKFIGSVYTDNMSGSANQVLQTGSLQVALSGTGSANPGIHAVPPGSITSTNPLTINLDFLAGAGFHGKDATDNTRTEIFYTTSHSDDDGDTSQFKVVDWQMVGYSDCDGSTSINRIKQYFVSKRELQTIVSVPVQLEICKVYTATVSSSSSDLGAPNEPYGLPWHPLYTINKGLYEVNTVQSAVGGGQFSGGLVDDFSIASPTVEFAPEQKLMSSPGSFTFDFSLPATATTTPVDLCVTTDYDTTQGLSLGAKNASTGSRCARPVAVLDGKLSVFVNPQSVQIIPGQQITFDIVVTNQGAGSLFNVNLEDTLPTGISPNLTDTNTANNAVGIVATQTGQRLDWSIGTVNPGQSIVIQVVADSVATSCAAKIGLNDIKVNWGCGGVFREAAATAAPNFTFLQGSLQTLHEVSNTESLEMCSIAGNSVVIKTKNTGATDLTDVEITEVTNPSTTGVSYVSGSAEVSTNGITYTATGDPTGTGTTLDPYTWSSTEVPALASVTSNNQVFIRYKATANEVAVDASPLNIVASSDAQQFCGTRLASPADTFPPSIAFPEITVNKVGRNVTNGEVAFTNDVYADPGDTVEWRMQIENSGDVAAQFMTLEENMPNSSGSPSGTLSGPGFTGVVNDGDTTNIGSVPASTTHTYTLTETIGAACVDGTNRVDLEWGCSYGSVNRLDHPTVSTASANLRTVPVFSTASSITQAINHLPGGRAEVVITVTNTTGKVTDMSILDTLPTNYQIDTTFTPTVTGDVATVNTNSTSPGAPVFTFTGEQLVRGESLTLTFRIKQSANFDSTNDRFTNPETDSGGNSLDPDIAGNVNNTVRFNYTGSCVGATFADDIVAINIRTPDLDLAFTPLTEVVQDATVYSSTWTITNAGEANSLADNAEFSLTLGKGWTTPTVTVTTAAPANSPYGAGSAGVCALDSSTATDNIFVCSSTQLGAIAPANSVTITVSATASLNGLPLNALGEIRGSQFLDDGSDSGSDYSFDTGKVKYVGVITSKTLLSTTEVETTNPNVMIGEDMVWRLRYEVFGLDGADPASQVSSITVRDTLPAGMGYVTHADAPGHNLPYTFTPPALGADNLALNFALNDINNPAIGGIFTVDLTTRVINNATSATGANQVNHLGAQFNIFSSTFASNDAADGFGGAEASLHKDSTVNVVVPTPTIVKQVRNVSDGGAFANSASGVAGDTLEYRIVVGNTGDAPLYDIVVSDAIPTKLTLIDPAADGVDNDGDGDIDDATEGTYNIPGDTVTFNQANTVIAPSVPSKSLAELDAGESITLLVRAVADISVTPDDTLTNNAAYLGDTLAGATGSQTPGFTAATNTPNGARQYTANDSADITIEDLTLTKEIVTTSLGSDASANVVVGEEISYRLTMVLPEGTTPNFKVIDAIPAGLKLIETSPPSIGASLSGCTVGGTAITPAVLPATGAVTMTYDFGTCVGATSSSDVNRTVVVNYKVVVDNIAGNINAATHQNSATYEFTGFTSAAERITTTVQESSLTIDKKFKSSSIADATIGLQAGDTVTYTITVNNAGTAPAYDLLISDLSDEDLVNATVSANPDNPGVATNAGTASGVTTWTWTLAGPLATATDYVFDVTYTLDSDVFAQQSLLNNANVKWTSLPGANVEERGSGGGVNDYEHDEPTPVTITTGGPKFDKTIKAPGTTSYAIGENVVYVLQADLPEGNINNVRFEDILPTGLKFVSSTLTVNNVQKSGGGAVTIVTGPAANATGTIEFDFDDLESTGSDPSITLEVTTRVINIAANVNAATRQNNAEINFENPDNPGVDVTVQETTNPTITIIEPNLTIDKQFKSQGLADPMAGLQGGDTVTYTITVTNSGTAPAYDVLINDLADQDLISPVASANPDNPGAPSNNGTTSGVTTWTWTLAGPLAAGGGVYKFDVTFTIDSDVFSTQELANNANTSWTSTAGTNTDERGPGGGINDYEHVEPTPVDVTIGSIEFDKTLKNPAVTNFNIGDDVVYQLQAKLVASELSNLRFVDVLPAGLKYKNVSLTANNVQKQGGGALTVVTGPAANATGTIIFNFGDVETTGVNPTVTLDVTTVVDNIVGNDSGDTLTNSGKAVYVNDDTTLDVDVAESANPTITVTEPVLTVVKTKKSQSSPNLEGGDTVTYTIAVTNSGTGAAHNLVISDLADEDLVNPVVVASPDNPGVPTNAGTVSGVTTWTWDVAGPIASGGGTYVFDVTYTIDGDVFPGQQLSNTARVTWTSTSATTLANPDERQPPGVAPNDYQHDNVTPISVNVTGITVEKSLKTAVTNFTVGDDVVYVLKANLINSELTNFRIRDLLPTGLKYVSATLAATNVQKSGGGALTFDIQPSLGDTGAIEFDFNDIDTTGASPSVTIEVTTRVQNLVAIDNADTLTNAGTVVFEDDDTSLDVTIATATDPTVTVIEPRLVMAIDGPTSYNLGSQDSIELNIVNTLTSPAYQPVIQVRLPADMRTFDPTSVAMSVTASGGIRGAVTFVQGVDYVANYVPGTGMLTLTLMSAAGYVDVSESLVVDFKVQPNNDVGIATSLEIVGTVTTYNTTDISGGAVDENRNNPTVFDVGTGGTGDNINATANNVQGDDTTDNHVAALRAPVLAISKAVDLASASPASTLNYVVRLTNTGDADAAVTSLVDDMDQWFEAGTLTNPIVSTATTTLNHLPAGGVNGTGRFEALGFVVPRQVGVVPGEVTITYSIDLKDVIPSSTVLANQTIVSVNGFTNPFVSDSTNPADNNLAESGNNAADATDDDPTLTSIISGPNIVHLKRSNHSGDGSVQEGDIITYSITVQNLGNENTNSSFLQDAVPANTTYLSNSTTLNGAPFPDVGGMTPLVRGIAVNSPGDGAGVLTVGKTATVNFAVRVNSNLANGTAIRNQATLATTGDGSGAYPPIVSDDPETSSKGDPTTDIVGSIPILVAQKIVTDLNGLPLTGTESIRYEIVIRNTGTAPATNVIFTDTIPTNTTYNPGSAFVDPNGPINLTTPYTAQSDIVDGDALSFDGSTVTVNVGTLAPRSEYSVLFDATVGAVGAGTVISNQGTVVADLIPPVKTDQNGNPDDGYQPTNIPVGNVVLVRQLKTVTDLNGGVLNPGEDILYTVTTENIGSVDATNVIVTDASLPPANTTYVAGSTLVAGSSVMPNGLVMDAAGNSALNGGIGVGTIVPGGAVEFTTVVKVDNAVGNGTILVNQAQFLADGGISGISDSGIDDGLETGNDPLNPNDDDPTRISIGGSDDVAILGGHVWLDVNHNDTFDSGETPQAGWTVEILLNGLVVDRKTTDTDGYYEFNGLQPGPGYEVMFRHPATGTTYGGPKSGSGGVTSGGTIQGLTLLAGFNYVEENLPIDPSGVFYDSISRQPVSNVAIEIVEGNGTKLDPSCLLPNQQDQVTGDDGRYKFDIVAPCVNYPLVTDLGRVCMKASAPAVYIPVDNSTLPIVTSTVIAGQPDALDPTGLPDPYLVSPSNDQPQIGEDTTYYTCFNLAAGDPNVVNNHIAVDPILDDAFSVVKTTPLTEASKGSLVPYSVTFKNNISGSVPNVDLTDVIPPGFVYKSGTATIDGVAIEPTTIDGRSHVWSGQLFTANQEKTLKMILAVGIGVGEGRYDNQAYVYQPNAARQVSNTAIASIRIVPDPIFDCPELVGKVFDDLNRNGYHDKGETGLPGVRLYTARGWEITSDQDGRYHIACPAIPDDDHGSNFVVKVDPRSLPTGYRMVSENPGLVRLTRGKMSKLNFAAAIHRVVRIEMSEKAFDENSELNQKYKDEIRNFAQTEKNIPSVLRIAYVGSRANQSKVNKDLDQLVGYIKLVWPDAPKDLLSIEKEILWVDSNGKVADNIAINYEYFFGVDDSSANYRERARTKGPGQEMCLTPVKNATARSGVEQNTPKVMEGKRIATEKPFAKHSIYFKVLKAVIDMNQLKEFKSFVDGIQKKGKIKSLHVVGNTDSDPILGNARSTFKDNWELSEYRANLGVKVIKEIYPDIPVTFEGKADTDPLKPNTSRANKAKNRRTEIWVYLEGMENSIPLKAQEPALATASLVADCIGLECFAQNKSDFKITLDGQEKLIDLKHTGVAENYVDHQRCTDVALEKADLQISFDPKNNKKKLALGIAKKGEAHVFKYAANYDAFIQRAEVRVYEYTNSLESKPLQILSYAQVQGAAASFVQIPQTYLEEGKSFKAILRVYGKDGNFDEALPLKFNKILVEDTTTEKKKFQEAEENQLVISGISVRGGMVTAHGRKVPDTHSVKLLGQLVPVDAHGMFVTQQILPADSAHGITISVLDARGVGKAYHRDIYIPENDWFFVGIADVTVGKNDTTGPIQSIRNNDHHYEDKVYYDGRLAFYLKGKVKGEYLITASVDSREQELSQLLKTMDEKDPGAIFRRLDPDKYYPVYGDESTFREDAPTQGKFYVKIEKDENYLMWGNLQSNISDTELAKLERSLYGAKLQIQSKKVMANKEYRTRFTAIAAEPGTTQAYEEFRGSATSFYWLRHRSLVGGSEKVRVEVRDVNSNIVLSSRVLKAGADYTMNYVQGQVRLIAPLPAFADQSVLVQAGSLSGNKVYLVVNYEYDPIFSDTSDLLLTARFSHWFGDHFKVGATGWKLDQTGNDQEVYATDLTVRVDENSYFKAEFADSKGTSIEQTSSLDGGYTNSTVIGNGENAQAVYAEANALLYQNAGGKGQLRGFYKEQEAGFSVPGQITNENLQKYSAKATLPLSKKIILSLNYDFENREARLEKSIAEVAVSYKDKFEFDLGVRLDTKDDLSNGTLTQADGFGDRLDAKAKVGYRMKNTDLYYLWHQQTLDKDDSRLANSRTGIGTELALGKLLKLAVELSYGEGGIAGKAQTTYEYDEMTNIYMTYLQETNSSSSSIDEGQGASKSLTSGYKQRFEDSMSIFYESKYAAVTGANQNLTHNFGVDYSLDSGWRYGVSVELGAVESEDGSSNIERKAGSVSAGFKNANTQFSQKIEYRKDDHSNSEDRTSIVTKTNLKHVIDRDWTLKLGLELLRSTTDSSEVYDGKWTNANLGMAYRPVDHDFWNMLLRYTYTEVLPSNGQVDGNGAIPDYMQRTHQASIDNIVDIGKYFTVGLKYGLASKQIRATRVDAGDWTKSNPQIGIARVDMHILHSWDLLAEYRKLWLLDLEQNREGMLFGIYRHLGRDNSFKLGLGYSFADFSDDLSRTKYDAQGWFVNMIGTL